MAIPIPHIPNSRARAPRSSGPEPARPEPSSRTSLADLLAPDPPPASELTEAALAAIDGAAPGVDLAAFWENILRGEMVVCGHGASPSGRYVFARAAGGAGPSCRALNGQATAVLVRVLGGEQQKTVAFDLDIACSTASKWYKDALRNLRIEETPIPLPLVIAAQAWSSGGQPPVDARGARFKFAGDAYFVVVVPPPMVRDDGVLTQAERMVARLLVEGEPRQQIALRRDTSAQTVACQLRSIFSKYRLTGRYSLVARATQLGWFKG